MQYAQKNKRKRKLFFKVLFDFHKNFKTVKKGLNFTIKIKIKENKPLFYYNNKLVLSNGDIIENKYNNIYGIPTLINDVNKEIFKKSRIIF